MGQVSSPVFLVRAVLLGDRQSVGPEWGQGKYSDSGQAGCAEWKKNGALDIVQKSVCVQVVIGMWAGDLLFFFSLLDQTSWETGML